MSKKPAPIEGDVLPPAPEKKLVETWAEEKGTPVWVVAALRAYFRWALGREVTEAEFDAGAEQMANAKMTSGNPFIERK